MDAQPPADKRRRTKLTAACLLLLALAVGANLRTLRGVERGDRPPGSPGSGLVSPKPASKPPLKLPADLGNPDARLTVEVFLKTGGHCECVAEAATLGQALGAIEPGRLRVVFRDLAKPEGRERLRQVNQLRSEAGLAINGKSRFIVGVPRADGTKQRRSVDLMGSAQWLRPELWAVLDTELRAAYEGKGLALGPKDFELRLNAETARLRNGTPQPAAPR